jgi:type IV pilus assembly protein PilA
MKPELQAKFLHYLNRKNRDSGFTLVELLVTIIIIGILVAIALPTFLNQTAKSKESEGRQYVGTANRAQTAYRAEHNQFAATFDVLALGSGLTGGSTTTTTNYSYTIAGNDSTATITATARDTALKGYYGANLRYVNGANQIAISSKICEAVTPGTTAPGTGNFTATEPECPANYAYFPDN